MARPRICTRKRLPRIMGIIFLGVLSGCAAACPEVTVDDLEILEETDEYVLIRHDGETGKLYKEFEFGFEDPDFLSWFGEGKWTTMSLLSPAAKDVEAYADLREKIFAGEADFVDNRIDPEQDQVYAGEGAARFFSVDPSSDMVTAKAMLENNALWFIKGDDLFFRGQFFIDQDEVGGVPFTLVDFQERGRDQSPGPRVVVWEQKHIGMELKYFGKPTFKQSDVQVPLGQWFELKVHLKLDNSEGKIQIWQDGELIIDTQGKTLPESNSLLNALEVGITATSESAVVFVDDVVISHHAL